MKRFLIISVLFFSVSLSMADIKTDYVFRFNNTVHTVMLTSTGRAYIVDNAMKIFLRKDLSDRLYAIYKKKF